MGVQTYFHFLYTKTVVSLTLAGLMIMCCSKLYIWGIVSARNIFANSHPPPLNNIHIIFWTGIVSIRAQRSPEIWPQLLMTAHQWGNHHPVSTNRKESQDRMLPQEEKENIYKPQNCKSWILPHRVAASVSSVGIKFHIRKGKYSHNLLSNRILQQVS